MLPNNFPSHNNPNRGSTMSKILKARTILFILLGVTALVVKKYYSGPHANTIYCYGGNFSVSFAVYFIIRIVTFGRRYEKLITISTALLVVELFEVTNGFGVMNNVYDPVDLVANLLGIGFALLLDTLTKGKHTKG